MFLLLLLLSGLHFILFSFVLKFIAPNLSQRTFTFFLRCTSFFFSKRFLCSRNYAKITPQRELFFFFKLIKNRTGWKMYVWECVYYATTKQKKNIRWSLYFSSFTFLLLFVNSYTYMWPAYMANGESTEWHNISLQYVFLTFEFSVVDATIDTYKYL